RVEHAAVPHRDPVIHGDGIELARHRAGCVYRLGDDLAYLPQVHMAGNELGEAVGDGDYRLADILASDPTGAHQCARSCHVPAVRDGSGSKRWHMPGSPQGCGTFSVPAPRRRTGAPGDLTGWAAWRGR